MFKMVLIVIVLVLLFNSKTVNCSMFSFMTEKLIEVKDFLKETTDNMFDSLKSLINFNLEPSLPTRQTHKPSLHKLARPRPTIIIEKVTESDYERPEFVNLRMEGLGTPQLAFWHGHSMESHTVRTKDGYSLCLHRLSTPTPAPNKTVLLHHGLLGSSTDWILLGADKSLPYLLMTAGYDVWIANARGNYFSRGHSAMTTGFIEFWNFSFHEMGIYDLPAVVKYIQKAKNSKEPINFIGHSMGGTALVVMLSVYPKYHKYFRLAILLAPLVYMNNVRSPMKLLARTPEEIVDVLGDMEFLPSRKLPFRFASKYCEGFQGYCTNPLFFFSGMPNSDAWTPSFIARMMYHIPAGGSTKTILHYLQIIKNRKFHRFNKPEEEYALKKIKLPIAVFSSTDDCLAAFQDVLKFYEGLQNPIDHHIIRERKMSHMDFVLGTEANIIVFTKILEYLEINSTIDTSTTEMYAT